MDGGISKRATDKLTDRSVQSFVKKAQAGKGKKGMASDGGGLYVTLTPAGTAVWRIKYRLGGVERLYAVGTYPEITLEAARSERNEVRRLLREGRDPVVTRRIERAAETVSSGKTFADVARVWLEKRRKDWSRVHYTKSKRALERDVYPRLGRLPIGDITPPMVTSVIESVAGRGARDTAAKLLQHVTGIFRYGQSKGLVGRENPALPAREALPRAKASRGRPALLKFPELGDVLRKAEAARLSPAVYMAHRLCAFAPGARISNVVAAEWPEFDLDSDAPSWTVPRSKMKARDRHHDHRIMLPDVLAEELRAWRKSTGAKGYLFPGGTGGATITRESLEKVYRVTLDLRDKHSPHGWRAAFSTLAREEGNFERDVVELALDHIHDNDVVRAYDRGERLQKRIKLAQWWGENLANAQRGADVLPLKGKRA